MIDETEIDNEVEAPETRKIIFEIELLEADPGNVSMFESRECHVSLSSVQSQDLCSELGKERSDIAMSAAKFKNLPIFEKVYPIDIEDFIAALYAPCTVRWMKEPGPIAVQGGLHDMTIDRR